MFFIPGILITLVTFPGVIVHEFAHQLFCRWTRVAVLEVVYFRVGNPAGYVIHEHPREKWQHILIGIGPFLVNSVIGALIAFPAAIPVFTFHEANLLDYLLIYLGVSIAMHAFPSTGDAQSMWDAIMKSESSLLAKIFVVPVVGLIYVGALGSMFWLDLGYGIAIAIGLPNLLLHWMS